MSPLTAVYPDPLQAVPVQQERSERVKTVADEIRALKM